jgi:hypothetical protein
MGKWIGFGFILFVSLLSCTSEKRVFYVNSYNQGYPPSDEVFAAIRHAFDLVQ